MSRINQLLTCGLLAVSVTGCQTARSVTSHVAQWRPFGNDQAEATIVESEAEPTAQPVLGDETAVAASSDIEQVVLEPEIQVVAGAEQPADRIEQAGTSAPATPPADDSFEAFIRTMEAQHQPASNSTDQKTQDAPVAQVSAPTDSQAIAQTEASPQAPAQGTEQLSSQIEALLTQNQDTTENNSAATASTQDAHVPAPAEQLAQQSPVVADSQVQPAALTEQKDASLVAYDLASFADVSMNKDLLDAAQAVKTQPRTSEEGSSGLNFADWAMQNSTQTAEAAAAPASDPFNQAFPWAGEKAQPATVAKASPENAEPADSATKSPATRQMVVSAEVLEMLENALGSENWKKAELVIKESADELTPDQQNILELMKNDSSKVRLRGLRLAYEQPSVNPALIAQTETMLSDKSLTVQAHAASTLYHWNSHNEKSVQTLSSIVTSDNSSAAQLAAMFLGDMSREREQVIPVLQTALLSTQGLTLMHVAEALLKQDPENVDAVARLSELMRHENVEVRWLAAHALGSVQGNLQPYAVEALRGGLRDIDPQVRATSALALGGLGNVSQAAIAELTFISTHAEPKVKDAANIALECIHQ